MTYKMDKDYIASEYRRMHKEHYFTGGSLLIHLRRIKEIILKEKIKTILDYGCGKATGHKKLLTESVTLYDPYYEPYSKKPEGVFDMVICTDVMEHVPEDEVEEVLRTLIDHTGKVLFLAISTKPAKKKFANGENVHVTVRTESWWNAIIRITEEASNKDINIIKVYT